MEKLRKAEKRNKLTVTVLEIAKLKLKTVLIEGNIMLPLGSNKK